MREQTIQKWLKIFIVFLFATFSFFVFISNLMDFNSNYEFVKHVLSMDTTYPNNTLMWRAINNKIIWLIAYWLLIIIEGLVALFGYISVCRMIKHINSSLDQFSRAKLFGYYMFILALALWYGGFIILGAEWFCMWESKDWNGKQTAMNITEVIIGFLIFYSLPLTEPKKNRHR